MKRVRPSVSDRELRDALREQGIQGLDELVSRAREHASGSSGGAEAEWTVVFDSGKWGFILK